MQETEHHTGLSYRVIKSNWSAHRVCTQSMAIARFNHTEQQSYRTGSESGNTVWEDAGTEKNPHKQVKRVGTESE